MFELKRYWERNGTRRPFPPLWQAEKLYGVENIHFEQPKYVEDGFCKWCGVKIENKRRKEFCSSDCSKRWNNWAVWGRNRDAYSTRICWRDNFTCQDCGLFLAAKNIHGIYMPVDQGLEVHHIKPVSEGGGDEPSNLVCLCESCHQKRHQLLREQKRDTE